MLSVLKGERSSAEVHVSLSGHVCGNCNDRLHLFAQAGFDAYHFEWQMDAQEVVKRPECAKPLATPLENLKAIVSAVHEGYSKNSTLFDRF